MHMFALVRDIFQVTDPAQWHNLNHTHSPISSHIARAGFAGCNDFMDIVTIRLSRKGT